MARTKQHIRRPDLPWRPQNLTECGRSAGPDDLSRDEGKVAVREVAKSRGGSLWMSEGAPKSKVCETCMGQLTTSSAWEKNPAGVLHREVERVGAQWRSPLIPAALRLNAELRAIAKLVEAHRQEFDEMIGGPGFIEAWSALAAFLQDENRKQGR